MKSSWRLGLTYVPSLIFLLCAAAIPANMRTGDQHVEFYENLRSLMLAGAFFWIVGAFVVRAAVAPKGKLFHAEQGYCVTCGYDLRATPDRCPECGTLVKRDAGLFSKH